MAMPKWHEFMQPVLVSLSKHDGLVSSKEIQADMIEHFSLTEEEQAERLSSGQLRFYNRLYWAITDLEKAKLVEYGEKKGTYLITDSGRVFLSNHDGPFTAKELMKECEAFRAWKNGYASKKKNADKGSCPDDAAQEQMSPMETMEASYGEMREALIEDLLAMIMSKSPYFFEYLVGRILLAMGYGEREESVTVTPKSSDEGIDGTVKEDRFGFDTIYYQAKRWEPSRTVTRPDIQAFVGALSGKGASRGLFITTAKFSSGAREYAKGIHTQKIVLVDGHDLAELMIDYGVGVSTKATFEIKEPDKDFFEEDAAS